MNRAEVISHSILPDGAVVVTVECPNGCTRRGKPATHTHGWTGPGVNAERVPHCGPGSAPYTLWWPDMPKDVVALARGQVSA